MATAVIEKVETDVKVVGIEVGDWGFTRIGEDYILLTEDGTEIYVNKNDVESLTRLLTTALELVF